MDLVAQIALFNLGFGADLNRESSAQEFNFESYEISNKMSLNCCKRAPDQIEENRQFLLEQNTEEF